MTKVSYQEEKNCRKTLTARRVCLRQAGTISLANINKEREREREIGRIDDES